MIEILLDPTVAIPVISAIGLFSAYLIMKILKKRGMISQNVPEEPFLDMAKASVEKGLAAYKTRAAEIKEQEAQTQFKQLNKGLPANRQKEDEEPEEDEEPRRQRGVGFIPIILIMIITFLSSCSIIDSAYKYAADNVEITWKADSAKDLTPIDSIVIKFQPVYWKETVSDSTLAGELERSWSKDGYSLWRLITPKFRRYEVQKQDTVIYIYRK